MKESSKSYINNTFSKTKKSNESSMNSSLKAGLGGLLVKEQNS